MPRRDRIPDLPPTTMAQQHTSSHAADHLLSSECDDADSVSSSSSSTPESLRKPLNSFEQSDVEDGITRRQIREKSNWWWGLPRRQYQQIEDSECRDALLERGKQRKRSWYNYCIFGGISGLTILAFLLILNLILGFATLFWTSDIDSVLRNWGQPGTGTEGLAWYPTDFTRDIVPIPCHSHNDYWRKVPLFSALRAGCTSVEADVWLFDEELYVGHNTASLTRNRTFQALYVNPIVKILQDQNPQHEFYNGTNHGVFDVDAGQTLTLLIDLKTSGPETWPWVLKQLEPLRERGWLTYVENDKLHRRPVTVVGTGNTPFDLLTANSTYRDAFFDAPLDTMWESYNSAEADDSQPGDSPNENETSSADDNSPSKPLHNVGQGLSGTTAGSSFTPLNSFYASVNFHQAVGRLWRGRLSGKQLNTIRGQIRGAHRRGLKVRYWGTPSWPLGLRDHVWDVLVKEGVDVLNVDDLKAASRLKW